MRLKEVVHSWYFNSDTGELIGSRPKKTEIKDPIVRYQLNNQTVFGRDVIKKWWNKQPLEVTYDDNQHRFITGNLATIASSDRSKQSTGPKGIDLFRAEKVELLPQEG